MKKVENVQDAWARWKIDQLAAQVGPIVGGYGGGASGNGVYGAHDELTLGTISGNISETLSHIPVKGTCQVSVIPATGDARVLIEGVHYVCNYSTGVVSVGATGLASGDTLSFRYLVAGTAGVARIVQTTPLGHANGGSGAHVTATFADTPEPGNVLVLVVSKDSANSTSPQAPGADPFGFFWYGQSLSPSTSGGVGVEVYTRFVQPGDGTTWQVNQLFSRTDAITIGLFEIAGSDLDPSGWTYSTQAASSSPLSQSVTETAGQLLLVGCAFDGGSASGPLTTITPSGFTDDHDLVGDQRSLIIGHETATGSAQSIGNSWDGTDGDAIQVAIAVNS